MATDYANCVTKQVSEPSTLRRYLSKPLRVLTKSDRASLRNMDDPRILQPHLSGFGWSINWAAVTTRLGIVRLDDIDGKVVSEIPARAMQAIAFLPATTTVIHDIILTMSWKRLPAGVHTKWKLNGEVVQRTASKGTLLPSFVVSTAGTGLSAASLLKADGRGDTLRVAFLSAFTSTIISSQLIGVLTEENSKLSPAFVRAGTAVASVAVSAAYLVLPLFAELKATWRKVGVA